MVTSLHYHHQPSTIAAKYNENYEFILKFTEFQMKSRCSMKSIASKTKKGSWSKVLANSAVNALSLYMNVQVNLHKKLYKKCAQQQIDNNDGESG